jgi:Amino acid permease
MLQLKDSSYRWSATLPPCVRQGQTNCWTRKKPTCSSWFHTLRFEVSTPPASNPSRPSTLSVYLSFKAARIRWDSAQWPIRRSEIVPPARAPPHSKTRPSMQPMKLLTRLATSRNFPGTSLCCPSRVLGCQWAMCGLPLADPSWLLSTMEDHQVSHHLLRSIEHSSNHGDLGVLYEFIVVSVFYWIVAACIAELASAIPSSAGVYQWASVTPGPKYGRVVGFFAGYWNWLAWVFGAASMTLIFVCCRTRWLGYH